MAATRHSRSMAGARSSTFE